MWDTPSFNDSRTHGSFAGVRLREPQEREGEQHNYIAAADRVPDLRVLRGQSPRRPQRWRKQKRRDVARGCYHGRAADCRRPRMQGLTVDKLLGRARCQPDHVLVLEVLDQDPEGCGEKHSLSARMETLTVVLSEVCVAASYHTICMAQTAFESCYLPLEPPTHFFGRQEYSSSRLAHQADRASRV